MEYFEVKNWRRFQHYKDRNPVTFWKVLANICINNDEFRQDLVIRLIGDVDISVWESIKEYPRLQLI